MDDTGIYKFKVFFIAGQERDYMMREMLTKLSL